MSDTRIKDGTGTGKLLEITAANRALVQGVNENIATERSRGGHLYGLGTGNVTIASGSAHSVLWLRNDGADTDMYIMKLIFGWNGGSTNFNRTIFSLIYYQRTIPTANNTTNTAAIENISRSGAAAAVTDANISVETWDGVSTGMTGMTGGYAQIPNRLAQGDTEKFIDGQIVLGQNDTMSIDVTAEETGLFHLSVVYYRAPAGGIEAES